MFDNDGLLKQARLTAGLTQRESAKLVYVTKRTWQYWECGAISIPLGLLELYLLKTGQNQHPFFSGQSYVPNQNAL